MTNDEEALRTEVNRLYWRSDESVGRIADKLGISRRALYDALRPHPTGHGCPDCGTGLVHPTRTARSAGEVECPGCGLEGDLSLLRQATAEAGSAMRERAEARRRERQSGGGRPAAAGESDGSDGEEATRQSDDAVAGGAGAAAGGEREIGIVVAAIGGALLGAAAALMLTRK